MRTPIALALAISVAGILPAAAMLIAAAPGPQQSPKSESPNLTQSINPTPHTYLRGDRLAAAYGPVSEVPDWNARRLPAPPPGQRWVHYGDTYLLVQTGTNVIVAVTPATWPAGRA